MLAFRRSAAVRVSQGDGWPLIPPIFRPANEREEHQETTDAGRNEGNRTSEEFKPQFPKTPANRKPHGRAKNYAHDPHQDELPTSHRQSPPETPVSKVPNLVLLCDESRTGKYVLEIRFRCNPICIAKHADLLGFCAIDTATPNDSRSRE